MRSALNRSGIFAIAIAVAAMACVLAIGPGSSKALGLDLQLLVNSTSTYLTDHEPVTFEAEVTNLGGSSADNIKVCPQFEVAPQAPAFGTYKPLPSWATANDFELPGCQDIATLAAGAKATRQFTVALKRPVSGGSLSVTVTTAVDGQERSSPARFGLSVQSPAVTVSSVKEPSPKTFVAGGPTRKYEVTVTNGPGVSGDKHPRAYGVKVCSGVLYPPRHANLVTGTDCKPVGDLNFAQSATVAFDIGVKGSFPLGVLTLGFGSIHTYNPSLFTEEYKAQVKRSAKSATRRKCKGSKKAAGKGKGKAGRSATASARKGCKRAKGKAGKGKKRG